MIWSLDKQSNSWAADITEDVNNKAVRVFISASKSSIRRFVITVKAPTKGLLLVESGYYRFHI